jgi:glycosyltransferase involved in cell wall biosynthesis
VYFEEPIELSVILPAYNEGAAVAKAVERYAAALPRFCRNFEIVVINDGSTDDTLLVARDAARDRPYVRVLNNETNLGQSRSLLRGFAEARGAAVMHNAMDLCFDPDDTGLVLDVLRQGADVVVVERKDRQAYGIVRKVISWGNILLTQALIGSPFTDHNFVQAFRRSVLEAIQVETTGVSTVTTELIVKAHRLGLNVRSLSAAYHARREGKSTITLGKILHTMRELRRLGAIMRRQTVTEALPRSAAAVAPSGAAANLDAGDARPGA